MNSEIAHISQNIYYFNLALTALVSGFIVKKYRRSYNRCFCYFLIYVFFVEMASMFPRYLFDIDCFSWIKRTRFSGNYWFYNFFWTIASTIFFSFYFQKTLKIKIFKLTLKYTRYIFLLSVSVLLIVDFDKFFKGGFFLLESFNTAVIIGCVVFFFLELLLTEQILYFYYNLNFYIASSILVWWLVTAPLGFYSEYYHDGDMEYVYLNRIIMACSNIFMYTCFAFGLLISKPQLLDE